MKVGRVWAQSWLAAWYFPAVGVALSSAVGLSPSVTRHALERSLDFGHWTHPFGFDAFGRDVLLITLRASVVSSAFAAFAVISSLALGAAAGTCMAMAPQKVRFFSVRALETLLAFPSLLFSLAWVAVRGPGWDTLAVSLLLGTVPSLTRLVYVRAREIIAEDYILAARSLGASPFRIVTRHLVPGIVSLGRVKVPHLFAYALMAEATLSFLGIGAPIGRDTWGSLLAQGKDYLIEAPHLAIACGLPLVLTVLSIQVLSSQRETAL